MTSGKRAFTLIELLVVIAIIAILAAILFPVIAGTKERARQAKCVANLKQLCAACTMYATDNSGRSPNPAFVVRQPDWEGLQWWRGRVVPSKGQIWPYVRSAAVYECPSDQGVPAKCVMQYYQPTDEMYEYCKKQYGLSYSMNSDFIDGYTGQTMVLDTIRRSKDVLMLIHENRETINDGGYNWHTYDDPSPTHFNGSTIGYVDGHATWKSQKQLVKEKEDKVWSPYR